MALLHCAPVHPRIRGERCGSPCRRSSGHGSSPHTRGTLGEVAAQLAHGRFIPAYAGNAKARLKSRKPCSVHPRIRGERIPRVSLIHKTIGSSPHTRGTLSLAIDEEVKVRFIPAYAGNAPVSAAARLPATVHPRIRGERVNAGNGKNADTGSSPHTRGTPIIRKAAYLKCRFIPAYAGNAHQR